MTNDTILLMDSLKEESLQLYNGMIVVDTYSGKERVINIPTMLPKFNGCFGTCASILCYVFDNKVFVTPFTSLVRDNLLSAGFREENFEIPFYYYDCPKKEKVKWDTLCEEASYEYEDSVDCLCCD